MRALLVVLAACGGGAQFGRIVTEVSPSPTDPRLLIVKSCALIETGKSNIEGVKVGDCTQAGVRRSPIVPVPLVEARVLAREQRIVTNFVERPGGGALVTTCRIGQRDQKWALLDCVETAIATAPLDAPAAPPGPPTTPPVPQPYPGTTPTTPPVPQPYPGPPAPTAPPVPQPYPGL